MPSFLKLVIVAGPNRSSPTRATMNTFAPHSRAATAWFAPFPPNPRSNFWPKIVSPGLGKWSENVVRSTFALPTTAMRGTFAIVFSLEPRFQTAGAALEMRKAECSQVDSACQPVGCPTHWRFLRMSGRSSGQRSCSPHRGEEPPQLRRVQLSIGSHARTKVDPERTDFFSCLTYILPRQTASQEQWNTDAFADRPA